MSMARKVKYFEEEQEEQLNASYMDGQQSQDRTATMSMKSSQNIT
jgi:hypothetical protein